jgi:hypothetical protein
MKCTACTQARYCKEECQLAHWTAHKADCKRLRAELTDGRQGQVKELSLFFSINESLRIYL